MAPLVKKKETSIPKFDEFDPTQVRFQHQIIYDVKNTFNYDLGTQIVLFSGAVGSGKTVTACHLIWLHALENPGADIGIGRKDLKRLKSTLLKPLLQHAPSNWKIGVDFKYNKSEHKITLPNNSTITCFSWADGDLERFKGEQYSMFVMDEATETDEEVFTAIKSRIGRLTHIKEKLFILLTNPDEPDHWINKNIINKSMYIDGQLKNRDHDLYNDSFHTYYSLTYQNKYVERSYILSLIKSNHKKWIERNLEGKWVSFGGSGVYFAYSEDNHFRAIDYKVDLNYPIHISWDFNVAVGKPMSVCFFQYIKDEFHFFEESIIQGSNTSKTLEDIFSRGLLDHKTKYIINGDAAGWHKGSATEGYSDYDIIDKFLKDLRIKGINYSINVPLTNPEVKTRHNTLNSYLMNGLNQARIFVYKKCPTLNEGFKLTKLKDGGKYIEDDSKAYQHVTTAAGYGIMSSISTKSTVEVLRF